MPRLRSKKIREKAFWTEQGEGTKNVHCKLWEDWWGGARGKDGCHEKRKLPVSHQHTSDIVILKYLVRHFVATVQSTILKVCFFSFRRVLSSSFWALDVTDGMMGSWRWANLKAFQTWTALFLNETTTWISQPMWVDLRETSASASLASTFVWEYLLDVEPNDNFHWEICKNFSGFCQNTEEISYFQDYLCSKLPPVVLQQKLDFIFHRHSNLSVRSSEVTCSTDHNFVQPTKTICIETYAQKGRGLKKWVWLKSWPTKPEIKN